MKKKIDSSENNLRKRIYEFFLANKSKGKITTVKHFEAENIPRSTIYDIIKRAESNAGYIRTIGSGRKPKIMTKKAVKRLEKMVNHKSGVSQSQAARKFGCSQQFISKTLKNKTSIKYRKKKSIPARTERQKIEARTKCGRLYSKFRENLCIIDDESYFTLSNSTSSGNQGFYSDDVASTPANHKFRKKAKFEKKLLVWICFSEKGISKPFFLPSGLAINQSIYLNECIVKRLIPFIKTYHSDDKYLFWHRHVI